MVTIGIGWKGYPGHGPTKCTKLKVYRPKTTCGHFKDTESVCSFDKKWRFIRQSKVTPMDLAICWDLTPEDPTKEPKPPTHIDGSNGSAAPAVFSLVHTPKEEEPDQKCDGIHGCGPLFQHGNEGNQEKNYFFHRTKNKSSNGSDCVDMNHNFEKQSASSQDTKSSTKSRAKSAYNDEGLNKKSTDFKANELTEKTRAQSAYNLNQIKNQSLDSNVSHHSNKIHQSTPNLSEIDKCSERHCVKKPTNHRTLECVLLVK